MMEVMWRVMCDGKCIKRLLCDGRYVKIVLCYGSCVECRESVLFDGKCVESVM